MGAHNCSVAVFIDGKSVGHTPISALTVSAGEHSVRMVNPLCTPVIDERGVLGQVGRLRVDRLGERGEQRRLGALLQQLPALRRPTTRAGSAT